MIIHVLALAAALVQQRDSALLQYEVNGLRVVQQPRQASSQMVAVELFLLGGARQVTADNAGIEPMYLMTSAYGTAKYPGELTRRALARTGGAITVSAEPDWTTFEFSALKSGFDSTWSVFADRLMHAALDSAGLSVVRQRMLGAVARRSTSPEAQAWFVADSMALRGHAYANNPDGNARSLAAITPAMLRQYAADQFVTSRMLLVVVGDLTREQVEGAVQRTLGTLPRGSYKWTLPEPFKPSKPDITAIDRQTSTNYIVGMVGGPARSSPDYPAFERALGFLSGWVSYVVRERNGLSYSAGVEVNENGAASAAIYVSTTNPDSAIKLVNAILTDFESAGAMVPRAQLRSAEKSFNARYLAETETVAGQASLLGRATLFDGDPAAAQRRAKVMTDMAFPDLKRSIRIYVKNIQYAFVGDTSRMPRKEMTKR